MNKVITFPPAINGVIPMKKLLLPLTFTVFMIGSANASLLIQELFDNVSAGDSNLGAGIGNTTTSVGFAGSNWVQNAGNINTANNFNVEPGIGLPMLDAANGGLWTGGGYATDRFATRSLSSAVDFNSDQVLYFSFGFNNTGDTAMGVGFASGSAASSEFVAAGASWNTAGLIGGGTASNGSTIGYGTLDTNGGAYGIRSVGEQGNINGEFLLVGRLTLSSAGNDSLDVITYSGGDTIDDNLNTITWDTSSSFASSMNASELLVYLNGNGAGEIDGIRVGTEWVDVTGVTAIPEPGNLALVIAGLLGLGFMVHRRR